MLFCDAVLLNIRKLAGECGIEDCVLRTAVQTHVDRSSTKGEPHKDAGATEGEIGFTTGICRDIPVDGEGFGFGLPCEVAKRNDHLKAEDAAMTGRQLIERRLIVRKDIESDILEV